MIYQYNICLWLKKTCWMADEVVCAFNGRFPIWYASICGYLVLISLFLHTSTVEMLRFEHIHVYYLYTYIVFGFRKIYLSQCSLVCSYIYTHVYGLSSHWFMNVLIHFCHPLEWLPKASRALLLCWDFFPCCWWHVKSSGCRSRCQLDLSGIHVYMDAFGKISTLVTLKNQQKTAKNSRKIDLGICIPPAHHSCQGYQLIHRFDGLALDNWKGHLFGRRRESTPQV